MSGNSNSPQTQREALLARAAHYDRLAEDSRAEKNHRVADGYTICANSFRAQADERLEHPFWKGAAV